MELIKLNRPFNQKKDLGAFYTPYEVTSILSNWAIRSASDKVMEPSFGGCSFLEAINDRIEMLSEKKAYSNLYGCDIDPTAFTVLHSKFPAHKKENFHLSDFLQIIPLDFSTSTFDVLIGNPPYISNHNMSKQQKEVAFSLLTRYKFPSSIKRASLWAYFILHALNFMKQDGRCAWVLPESFLFAAYSTKVRERYFSHFKKNLIIQLHERLFIDEGTDEKTLIVLSDGFSPNGVEALCNIADCDSYSELKNIIERWDHELLTIQLNAEHPKLISLDPKNKQKFYELFTIQECRNFGDLAEIRIGIVTGANKFFIVNPDTIRANHLEEYSENILARFKYVQGISFNNRDLIELEHKNERIKLINTALQPINNYLSTYLESFPIEEKEKNYTFRHKVIWHDNNDQNIPDAFFPYMDSNGPTLVLNQAQVNATNTIHRVYFRNKKGSSSEHKLLSLSMLSSFSQISSELEGRIYGSNMLKHEPSDIAKIKIILPENIDPKIVSITYKKVDTLIRNRQREKAVLCVDEFLSQYITEYSSATINHLQIILHELRRKRKGNAR